MKIKSTFLALGALLLAGFAQAQDWNWPADPAQEAKARELNAAYTDYMKSEQFVEATKPLNWLLVNVPELNESLYINGVNVYKGAADKTEDAAQKAIYQDSVMLIYEKRGEIYNNAPKWIENKAYFGYQFYKSNKEKIPGVIADFEKALELNGTINYQLVAAYFDLIYRNFQLLRYNLCQGRKHSLSHFDFRRMKQNGIIFLYLKPILRLGIGTKLH